MPGTVLAVVLLVLFSLQSVAVAAELGGQDLCPPELLDSPCTPSCSDDPCDDSGSNSATPCADGSAHCDDCGLCMGCHLTAMIGSLAAPSLPDSGASYSYLARLTTAGPTSIDRPPIA
ncbi:MAG: hypothetical protein KDI33_07345 [Halioglobus sp.]|nr:hypothetical protein [Halioglobus sp.]